MVRLHWVLSVDLPKEAARFIDPDDVAWVEETRWNLADRSARRSRSSRTRPQGCCGRRRPLRCSPEGDDAVRTITGELKVRIPLLGHKVEPAIVDGVGDHLEEEAAPSPLARG